MANVDKSVISCVRNVKTRDSFAAAGWGLRDKDSSFRGKGTRRENNVGEDTNFDRCEWSFYGIVIHDQIRCVL